MSFWVYILHCADNSYYTGQTDNLDTLEYSSMRYIHRELERGVMLAARSFPAVVLTGPRRASEDIFGAKDGDIVFGGGPDQPEC